MYGGVKLELHTRYGVSVRLNSLDASLLEKKRLQNLLKRDLDGRQIRSGRFGEKRVHCSSRKSNADSSIVQCVS